MKINYLPEPFPHVVIHDYFEPQELELIWDELRFLTKTNKLLPPEKTSTATGEDGKPLKKNYGLFIYEAYKMPEISDIARCSRKLFYGPLMQFLGDFNYLFKYLSACTRDDLLISYYNDGCYYEPHTDCSVLTAIVNLHKEPRAFEGGDLIFPEYNYQIPIESNRLVLFAGPIQHQVEKISMQPEKEFSGNGRYSLTTLIKMV